MKLISIQTKLITAALIIFMPLFSYSAPKKADSDAVKAKKPILIFNFSSSDQDDTNAYYSSIIPDAILKNISFSPKFSIKKIDMTPEFKDIVESVNSVNYNRMSEIEMKEYLKNLRKEAKEAEKSDHKADYIITGNFKVGDDKQIQIAVKIYDLEGKTADIIVMQDGTNKVIFTDTIAEITDKIYDKISEFEKGREKSAKSPFLPLYKVSSIFSFGVESGYIFLLQPWTGIYNNPVYARPNITAHIGKYFGISANILYFNLDTWNMPTSSLNMTLWAPSLDLHFFLNLKYFHLSISAGGGFAFSHIFMFQMSMDPFAPPVLDKISYDAYIDSSLSIGVNLGPVTVRVGSSYKLILYTNTPLHMISVFGGFQYRI